jgi:uncharacterized protein (TIGR03437 family)
VNIVVRLLALSLLVQVCNLLADTVPAKSYLIQTVAGSDTAADGGPATAASFSQTEGIAVDSAGAIYVADADDNRVRKIGLDGTIRTIAGTGIAGFQGDGGPATAALLSHPYGLAMDAIGNLYIADLGNARIRKVSIDGNIQTIAGGGFVVPGGNGDGGPAIKSQLLQPRNVAVESDGMLYISDFGAHRVYQVTPYGILTTLAGTGNAGFGGDGNLAQFAQLKSPAGLACDSNGTLYIADSGNNRIRKVFRGIISTVYSTTGPTGLAMSAAGSLYVASASYFGTSSKSIGGVAPVRDVAVDRNGIAYVTNGQFVRKVAASGAVTNVAGSGNSRYFGGDNGLASAGRLHGPSGVAVDDVGNVYVADTVNHRVRKISQAGIITTIAGTGEAGSRGDNGPAIMAQLNRPRSIAVDAQHNVYIADTGNNAVRKITSGGIMLAVTADLNDPEYVAVGLDRVVYIADAGNNRIVRVGPGGTASTFTQVLAPAAVTLDHSGNLFVSGQSRVARIAPGGLTTTMIDGLNSPRGLALTEEGDLLIVETGVSVVRRLTSARVLATIAGTGVAGFSGDGDAATVARLNSPLDLALDANGTVWIADSDNNRIRSLTPSLIANVVAPAAIVHAATLAPGPIAPGEIITIFGNGFDPDKTQLLFDGQQGTIFYIGLTQINALAPVSLIPNSSTDISVVVNGTKTVGLVAPVVKSKPGIFTVANGIGQAAANNEDGSINSELNPAARGSIIVLYGTGGGSDLSATTVKIGAYAAEVLYAGPAPGFPGLMQINARVPSGFLPPGIQPVVLTVSGAASQDGVTVAVH